MDYEEAAQAAIDGAADLYVFGAEVPDADEKAGKLNHQRMERYRDLLKECRENWRERYD